MAETMAYIVLPRNHISLTIFVKGLGSKAAMSSLDLSEVEGWSYMPLMVSNICQFKDKIEGKIVF